MALISATDTGSSGNVNIKQRFATVLISSREGGNANANVNNVAGNNVNDTANKTKKVKEVKVVSQRLWAFRPSF